MLVRSEIICMCRKISKICYASVLLSTLLLFYMISHYKVLPLAGAQEWQVRAPTAWGKARLWVAELLLMEGNLKLPEISCVILKLQLAVMTDILDLLLSEFTEQSLSVKLDLANQWQKNNRVNIVSLQSFIGRVDELEMCTLQQQRKLSFVGFTVHCGQQLLGENVLLL